MRGSSSSSSTSATLISAPAVSNVVAGTHEGARADLEAFLDGVNRRVTGEVRLRLHRGSARVVGTRSPYSMMDPEVAVYGEGATAWSGGEAAGFARIYGLASMLAQRAGERGERLAGTPEGGDR